MMRSLFWKEKPLEGHVFGALFKHFRQILALNNQVLEMVADLERALGGEYIYDSAFLKSSVTGIIEKGRQVIYHLNSMTHDNYAELYDQFTAISDHLTDILAGGAGPYGGQLVLSTEMLHRDLVHLAGGKGASLGEIRNNLKLPSPPLFVLSVTGYRVLMEENDLFLRINQILGAITDPSERSARIDEIWQGIQLPSDLLAEIRRNLRAIKKMAPDIDHFAVRSSAVGEDGERSFAGQFQSILAVKGSDVPSACLAVIQSRFSERVLRYIDEKTRAEDTPMAVVVQPMITSLASGVLYTRDPNDPAADIMVISAIPGAGDGLVRGRVNADRFVVGRRHPFTLISSKLGVHQENSGSFQYNRTSSANDHLRRGSGVIDLTVIHELAEYALLLEKRFEWPQDIEWCLDGNGHVWILQSRPLALQSPADLGLPEQLATALKDLPVIISGRGHIGQLGMACGPVVHVSEDTPADTFPVGAIAVSHYASPRLAGVVEKAAAIITDIGSPTGHLATIAREYRTPALFGVEDATGMLPEGQVITVDVEERTISAGYLEIPPDLPRSKVEIHAGNPEASILRRLLRLIAPLNLTNPNGRNFNIESCQTIHDFLRFSHEKAVAELTNFQATGSMTVHSSAPVLEADIPLNIRLIDLGGGLLSSPAKRCTIKQISSLPLRFLLQGISNKSLWNQTPASFGARDFFSSLSRPISVLTNPPVYSGENIAIIAQNYCNLSLRLGYHFNIIDSYLSDDPDDNYIYFRFVGGFAEKEKRNKRAALIGQILTGLHFKIEQHGDLVQGKAKMLERGHLERILLHIGELVAFTRQLDVRMSDEEAISQFYEDFLKRIQAKDLVSGY